MRYWINGEYKECHSYDEGKVTKAATCTEDGEFTYTCKVKGCGHTKTDVIKATGHDWKETKRLEPTKTEDGYIEFMCRKCGETKRVKLPKTGATTGSEPGKTRRRND